MYCFMSTLHFLLCTLPTLYLVPACFLLPFVVQCSYRFIFVAPLPLLHILVRSPTPRPSFWTLSLNLFRVKFVVKFEFEISKVQGV
ncbi:hypothetical protein BDV12DRAFT_146794 [Aspergillus spectabilis]